MNKETAKYNAALSAPDREVCDLLAQTLSDGLPEAENKIWHRHPVWFLDGNPIVGYSKLKAGIRLMFWSGADFNEGLLRPGTGKFKDASILYATADQVDTADIARWCKKAREIQWDYKNLIKRKGVLERL